LRVLTKPSVLSSISSSVDQISLHDNNELSSSIAKLQEIARERNQLISEVTMLRESNDKSESLAAFNANRCDQLCIELEELETFREVAKSLNDKYQTLESTYLSEKKNFASAVEQQVIAR